MRWARNLIAALIVGTAAIVALTLWQIAADTPPPVHLPVPKVQVVRVPTSGPGVTVINHYLPMPTAPPSSLRSEPAPTVNRPATTTTRASAPPPARPHPAPCTTVPVLGTCLP